MNAEDLKKGKERFLSKTEIVPSGCLEWRGYRDSRMGYGMFWLGGTMRLSHRVAYEMFKGKIPDGLHVCHSCDNPACVNPDHLWIGTNSENVHDKVSKGRVARMKGEKHPGAKLSDDLVRQIRASLESGRSIAKRLGVDRSTIQYIRKGRLWRHVL